MGLIIIKIFFFKGNKFLMTFFFMQNIISYFSVWFVCRMSRGWGYRWAVKDKNKMQWKSMQMARVQRKAKKGLSWQRMKLLTFRLDLERSSVSQDTSVVQLWPLVQNPCPSLHIALVWLNGWTIFCCVCLDFHVFWCKLNQSVHRDDSSLI